MKTLILLFHPDFSSSKANAALVEAARSVPGVEIVDMQALYPEGKLDMMTDGGSKPPGCSRPIASSCNSPSSGIRRRHC